MDNRLSHLQLRHYRLIHAIAEHGQLSIAANRLAMTQPAASRILGDAERTIGQPLFERHPKGMSATPIGEVMGRHAATLLNGLDHAISEMDAFRAGKFGSARVGAVTGAAVGFVVPAIKTLKARAPNAEIRIDVAPSVDLMDGILNGEHDFVLSRVPPDMDTRNLRILHGKIERIDLLVHRAHPLLGRHGLDLADLVDYTWISQAPGMPIREALAQAFLSRGIPPPGDFIDSASLLVILAYLQSSDAIAPVSTEVSSLLRSSAPNQLGLIETRSRITLPPYHLIRDARRAISPLAQGLLDLVLRNMSEDPADVDQATR